MGKKRTDTYWRNNLQASKKQKNVTEGAGREGGDFRRGSFQDRKRDSVHEYSDSRKDCKSPFCDGRRDF